MKQILFTFLLLSTVILTSCRKDKVDPNISEYDDLQIQNYIKANNISGMVRDTSDTDTAGMYYQILNEGNTANPIQYSDYVSMVYTIRSFDGKYKALDTITNHYAGYLGQFSGLGLPKGLQSAIHNVLKYKGGSMRLLIPSRLAYGINGYGSGSSGNVDGRIDGNQCLDYFVRIVDNQDVYDQIAIEKYKTANSLTGYTVTPSGLHYKISGLDTGATVSKYSRITAGYKLYYLNGTLLQETTTTDLTALMEELRPGVQEGLLLTKTGQTIS
ncbi:MAG: hypothetical protein EOP54_25530, partial [Sphingobacteriales bacterium]